MEQEHPDPRRVAVKFRHVWSPYNPGEIAGFAPGIAQGLVDGGLADFLEPPTEPALQTSAPDVEGSSGGQERSHGWFSCGGNGENASIEVSPGGVKDSPV